MKFIFKAKNKLGEMSEGFVDAADKEAAVLVLQEKDLFPISIAEYARNDGFITQLLSLWDSVSVKDLLLFFRQLAILIEARVPIVPALVAIQQQAENEYLKNILSGVIQDVNDGLPFSDALAKYPDTFSSLSVNIIRSGEISGNLRQSVLYVSDSVEKNYLLTSRIRSASVYPAVILLVFTAVGFAVMTIVMPKLTQIIKDMGVEVPWYTTLVIRMSDFMLAYWWAILIAFLGFIAGLFYYIKSEEGIKEWDRIKLKLPVFGNLFKYVYLARFADNLSVLLAGGIPIINALQTVSSVVGNSVYENIFLKTSEEVKIGGTMSNALSKYSEIPPIVSHMIKIGEDAGQIDAVLGHVSKFYEEEANQITKNMTTLLEPVMIVVIGIAVAFLAVSVIMPIYNLAGQM